MKYHVGQTVSTKDGYLTGKITNWWLEGETQVVEIEATNNPHKPWRIKETELVDIEKM